MDDEAKQIDINLPQYDRSMIQNHPIDIALLSNSSLMTSNIQNPDSTRISAILGRGGQVGSGSDGLSSDLQALRASHLSNNPLIRQIFGNYLHPSSAIASQLSLDRQILSHHLQQSSILATSYAPHLNRSSPFSSEAWNQFYLRQHTSQMMSRAIPSALTTSGAGNQTNVAFAGNPINFDLATLLHGPRSLNPHPRPSSIDPSPVYGDSKGLPAPDLPITLAMSEDSLKLSAHQVLLRQQIEVFRASDEDLSTHTRGRNKPIVLNQVGIRCKHCAHLPVLNRQKGSTYFPAAMIGLYQAAQNMSTTHMQCGLCPEMPTEIKEKFAQLISTKLASSGAGRKYWARAAKKLGLVDTDNGIRFIRDLPREAISEAHDDEINAYSSS